MIAHPGKVSDMGIEDIKKFICEFVCKLLDQQNLTTLSQRNHRSIYITRVKKIQRADLVRYF